MDDGVFGLLFCGGLPPPISEQRLPTGNAALARISVMAH
jgi:hypothetical protein